MAPYDEAADIYLASGFSPVPVLGKHQPVHGTTGYTGTVTSAKVAEWTHPDPARRARAGRGVRVDNIGLRHQLTLAVDVDHGYGEKNGVQQLAEWAEKLGLPALPATWSSTARGDDSPSRQYLYRIPEDVKFKTKPCKSVELCTWHHRFTVCAPSVHPDTGGRYTWHLPGADGVPPTWGAPTGRYPTPAAFAVLPAEWFTALRGGVANADKTVTTVDVPALLETFPAGEPDRLVRHLIETWSDPAVHVGHDEAKNALLNAFMLGREGHRGVPQLFRVIVDRLAAYLAVARPDMADAEMNGNGSNPGLIAACAEIAQQKPLNPLTVSLTALGVPVPTTTTPTPDNPLGVPGAATDDEVALFLATYTRYQRPDRLGRRAAWLRSDEPARIGWHARCMVQDVLDGHYPAARALDALTAAYSHHGGRDPAGPTNLLRVALGAVLASRIGASA